MNKRILAKSLYVLFGVLYLVVGATALLFRGRWIFSIHSEMELQEFAKSYDFSCPEPNLERI